MGDKTPRLFVSNTARGRLALMLANTYRVGAGQPVVEWAGLPDEVQISWWEAAGDFLPKIIDTKRLAALVDDLEHTLEDLSAVDTKSLPDAFKALLD